MHQHLILFAAVLLGTGPLCAAEHPAGTAVVERFGYSECIELKNADARVVPCPHGDRVLEYFWKGRNSLWYFKDLMCELEPIGPAERLVPDRSASCTEEWRRLPYKFPAAGNKVDLDEVARLVGEKAKP
jgi:hypothetical protein